MENIKLTKKTEKTESIELSFDDIKKLREILDYENTKTWMECVEGRLNLAKGQLSNEMFLIENIIEQQKKANEKIESYNKLPWYKRIFAKI